MTSRQIEQQLKKLSTAFRKGQIDFAFVLPYPSQEWEYSKDGDTCVMKQGVNPNIVVQIMPYSINIKYYIAAKDSAFMNYDYISITRPFKYYSKVRLMWQELCNA